MNISVMESPLKEGFPHCQSDLTVATYVGSGSLVMPGDGRIPCRFRVDQDANGKIQIVLTSISPIDFIHYLLPTAEGGVDAS
jgi:hypothetical protein